MTDFKESKRKKFLHNIDSFFRVLSQNEEERMVKPQKVNRTVDPRQKPDLMTSFDIPSHDRTSVSQKQINHKYMMEFHSEKEPRHDTDISMTNSSMLYDQRSKNPRSKKNLNHTLENNGQQLPIIEQKSFEKILKGQQFGGQKPRNFLKKKQQLKQVNNQQRYIYEAQRQFKKKIPQNFNLRKNEIQNSGYFNNKQDDEDISEILHQIECSQIGPSQIESYFPEIKNLKKVLTSEQLKAVICDTIREEIKRAKNPLISSQEKFKLNERHRDLANNLNKNRIFFNQNIIHQGGRKSGSNRNNPPYDEFSFGDDQQMPQNYQNQIRSSKATSQKLYQYAMNLRDTDPQNFKQFSQKIKANRKTQKDKKIAHNTKVILGTIATIGGLGIKVATDVQKHYRQTSTSINSNVMSCGKAMVGGAVGKMLANKINPKLRNYGALVGVLATSKQAKSRMAKVLQKTSKYLNKFDKINGKKDDTNQQNLEDTVQQEFIYQEE